MQISLDTWKREHAESIMRQIGVDTGQKVLDFGCGSGSYTIPIAKVVGIKGLVYALDENKEDLHRLINEAKSKGFENIVKLEASYKTKLPLSTKSIDIVLLYDVLHYYYFPEEASRLQLLREVHRVLKPNGILSLYPTHLETGKVPKLDDVKREIENSNFIKEGEHPDLIMAHEDKTERGLVINFRKVR